MILQGMEGRKGYGHRGQDVKYKKSHYIFVFYFFLYISLSLLASFLSFVPLSGIIRWIGRPCIQNPGATPRCIFYFANGNNVLIQLKTHINFFLNNPFFLFQFPFLFACHILGNWTPLYRILQRPCLLLKCYNYDLLSCCELN